MWDSTLHKGVLVSVRSKLLSYLAYHGIAVDQAKEQVTWLQLPTRKGEIMKEVQVSQQVISQDHPARGWI